MTTIPHLHYGVYSKDWVVSVPVKFQTYKLLVKDLTKKRITTLNKTINHTTPSHNNIVKFE